MKYSDTLFQKMLYISPKNPNRSEKLISAWIDMYELDKAEINQDFLIGFQYGVSIIAEKLKEER